MPRLTAKTEYKRLRGQLMVSEARDFEKASLPLIRLLSPDALGTPPLGEVDRIGVDQLAWKGSGDFELVVQCKGFKIFEKELGRDCSVSILGFYPARFLANRCRY